MAKVYHVTLLLEVGDQAEEPENWDWFSVFAEIPLIRGFNIIEMTHRPYRSMEDDPIHHTLH